MKDGGYLAPPFLPHGFPCVGGIRDTALGDGGGANVGGNEGTWEEHPGVSGVLIRVLRVGCVAPSGEVSEACMITRDRKSVV